MGRVLIACEFSGIVREAFRARGHFAYSCDLLSTEIPGPHFKMDVLKILDGGWDLMIGHPPCTYLTVSANKWLKDQPPRKSGKLVGTERRKAREDAISLFLALWESPIKRIAIENPVGCMSTYLGKPEQVIHPYYFGDPVGKGTCLWLKGLPNLRWAKEDHLFGNATVVQPEIYTTASGTKYPAWSMIEATKIRDLNERSKFRSKTFPGIANAMAAQWGPLL